MKRICALILLVALSVSCKHFGPGTPVGDCGREVSAELLPSIESALVSGQYVAELAELAGRFGVCLIRNGVEYVVEQSKTDVKFGAMDRNTMTKIKHGNDYLERTAAK